MSIDTRPTSSGADSRKEPRSRRGRPVNRTIAGSVAAGAATALGLTLGVFPGATESVTTGAVLLAFGFGWALLAVLSIRRTSQPQRWAAVPAGAMATAGVLLCAFRPGNAALTALNWVWPVAMAVLVAWMIVQIKRHSAGYGRWILTAVVAVLGVASLGATYENIASAHDQSALAAPGRLIEVNGHQMHLDCRGHGAPTVVLFNGMGEVTASWSRITAIVARTARVCAFDRAGQGWSQDDEHPQDGVTAAKDLHSLLSRAGEEGPFVLAGHSVGGTYAMTYAARYPTQVAGMALLDSSSPEQFTRMPAYPGQYAALRRVYALLPTFDRLGLGRVAAAVAPSHLPAAAARQVRAVTVTAHGARNQRDEAAMLHQVFRQAQALTSLHGEPLAVLTASASLHDKGWAGAQDALAALSGNHLHEVVQSSHMGLLEDPAPATRSIRAISSVLEAVRAGSPIESR